jgi:hypothetical protein
MTGWCVARSRALVSMAGDAPEPFADPHALLTHVGYSSSAAALAV